MRLGISLSLTQPGGIGSSDPVIVLSGSRTINENIAVGTLLGTLSVNNPPGGVTYTFAITADPASLVALDGDDVETEDDIDFETNPTFSFEVTATGSDMSELVRTFNFTVVNLDEVAPTVSTGTAFSVNEGVAWGVTLAANEPVTWTKTGGSDAAKFVLSGADLSLVAKDYDNPDDSNTNNTYVVQVTATDAAGNATNHTITVTILDIDDTAPTITSMNAVSVDEGEELAHSLTANESVTWTITGGADQGDFELSGSTLRWLGNGVQSYDAPVDSDSNNVYVVQVTATDTNNNSTNQTISVTVDEVVVGGAAMLMLSGETNGFAIDADADSLAIKDTTTPANNYDGTINGKLTNAGTSPKMIVKSDGTVGWAPHNLLTQSEDFSYTYWSGGGLNIVGKTLTDNGGDQYISRVLSVITGARYCFTAWIQKDNDETRFPAIMVYDPNTTALSSIHVNTKTGTTAVESTGSGHGATFPIVEENGYWRVSVVFTAVSTGINIYISPARGFPIGTLNFGTTGSIVIDKVQFCRGGEPLEYLPTTTATRFGVAIDYSSGVGEMLFEEARTNLFTRSEEFNDAIWVGTEIGGAGSTITANAVAAPDTRTTADKIVETAMTGEHGRFQAVTLSPGSIYTFSCFVKAAGRTRAILRHGGTGSYCNVEFNLSAGTVAFQGAGQTGNIVSLADGWYRISTKFTSTIGSVTNFVVLAVAAAHGSDAGPSYLGDGTSGLYAWGAQLEVGSIVSSYIPTLGTTVTRAVDIVTLNTSLTPFSATAGSMMLDLINPDNNVGTYAVGISSGNHYADSYTFRNFIGSIQMIVFDDTNAVGVCTSGSAPAVGAALRMSGAWSANDYALSHNGSAVGTDTSGALPNAAMDKFSFGYVPGLTVPASVRAKRYAYVPRRVSNGDLPTWMS